MAPWLRPRAEWTPPYDAAHPPPARGMDNAGMAVDAVVLDALTFNDALSEIALLARHDHAQASARCDALLASYPDAVRVIRARASAREGLGDLAGAAADYDRALDIVPDDLATMTALARCHMKAGRTQEGLLAARQALDHDASERDALCFLRMAGEAPDKRSLGKIAEAKRRFAAGQAKAAVVDMRRFIADHPNRPDAEIALAEMLWRMGRPIAAAEACQRLLDDDSDCLAAHVVLHQVWARAHAEALAAEHARAIEQFDPDRRFIALHLGDLADGIAVTDAPAARPATPAAAYNRLDDEPADEQTIETEAWVSELAASSAIDRTRVAGPEDDAEGPVEAYAPLDWLPAFSGEGGGDGVDRAAPYIVDVDSVQVDGVETDGAETLDRGTDSGAVDALDGAEPAAVAAVDIATAPPPVADVAPAAEPAKRGGLAPPEGRGARVTADEWLPADRAAQPAVPAAPESPVDREPKKAKLKASDALSAAVAAREGGDLRGALRSIERVVSKGKKAKETVAQLEALLGTIPEADTALRAEAYRVLGDAYLNADRSDDAMRAYQESSRLLK